MLYISVQDSWCADDNGIAAKHLSWNYHPVMLSKPKAFVMRAPWWKWSLGLLRKPLPCHHTCHAWPNTKYGVTSASTLSKGWQKEKDCVKASDLQNQNCKQTSVQLKVKGDLFNRLTLWLDIPSRSIKRQCKMLISASCVFIQWDLTYFIFPELDVRVSMYVKILHLHCWWGRGT